MRPGTPGFVGERLRQAREARGLSVAALAEIVSVSRQQISQYENGVNTPHPETLLKIAKGLNLPLLFFQKPMPPRETGVIFW